MKISVNQAARRLVVASLLAVTATARGEDLVGTVESVDVAGGRLVLSTGAGHDRRKTVVRIDAGTATRDGLDALKPGLRVRVKNAVVAERVSIEPARRRPRRGPLAEFWHNFTHNLFKPLLLFFYLGFAIVLFKVEFEFPYAIYQGLTIYLLVAIGWKGGEELADLDPGKLGPILGFMGVGFATNLVIGVASYLVLGAMTRLRRVDRATVAGYYGSDSAGTFVTCLGVLASAGVAADAYMPVMLAVMEVPGCLVALYLVSQLRQKGMDPQGNMPDEPGHDPSAPPPSRARAAVEMEKELSLEKTEHEINGNGNGNGPPPRRAFDLKLLHEVFLNPGLVLLVGGIVIGFIGRLQGEEVTRPDDPLFLALFQGILCLFLLEMGMTAARKLRDLRSAGPGFIAFGLIAPNVFATCGILVARGYGLLARVDFEPGTYVLFAVLCGAASYIAVPAVQRLAIPEASPTLPLAASLGLTFSYNVTVGIPIYMEIARYVTRAGS